MSEETTTTTETTQAQITVDEPVNNTGADNAENNSGAGTDTAQQANQEATTHREKTFTQNEVDKMFQQRLSKAVKTELKKLAGENPDAPNVEQLQRELQDYQMKARTFEAKESIREYLLDAKNKISIQPGNTRVIEKLIFAELQFDDDGRPENLKEAIDLVKTEAPTLFVTQTSQINGNNGRNQPATPANFSDQIRARAGYNLPG